MKAVQKIFTSSENFYVTFSYIFLINVLVLSNASNRDCSFKYHNILGLQCLGKQIALCVCVCVRACVANNWGEGGEG